MFLPSKFSARNALADFLPKCGRDYATGRNYDRGRAEDATVSKLSPYIRMRLLPEWEVLSAVLKAHSTSEASKFIDEVCWRTYWKGWLQLRPSIWQKYLEERQALLEDYNDHTAYNDAIGGQTGIECFDAWAAELVEQNYLHNHARMWTASIWTHTLKLPWQLGADWFLRHLLDGDPASNTLSWRWVAGLHTAGKAYLARADNIRKYTNGRFEVNEGLASEAIDVGNFNLPEPITLPQLPGPESGMRLGLLTTEEDLSAADWIGKLHHVDCKASYFPRSQYDNMRVSPAVIEYRFKSLSTIDCDCILEDIEGTLDWARKRQLDAIVMTEPTTGHWPDLALDIEKALADQNIQLIQVRHWWDEILYPSATHGFFRFKKAIPRAISRLTQLEFPTPLE